MTAPHIHVPYNRLTEHLALVRQQALNLELYFDGRSLDAVTPADIRHVRELLDYGPSLSFHAPFMDLSPGAVDTLVREATMKRFFHILEIAEILEPKVIVCHSGYEKWRYALKPEWWLEMSLLTWQPLIRRASDINVKLAIENIFEEEPSTLKMLMQHMAADNFGICFDTGHCNLFSKVPLEDWMAGLNDYIIELHLHDNDRSSDQHLPVGEGTFDFRQFFSLLKNRDCIVTIEAHSPDKVFRSMENIARLTGSSSGSS